MLCYACAERVLDRKPEVTGVTKGPDSLPNLLAEVFLRRLKLLLRRGLDRTYLTFHEDTPRPRGRVDFQSSIKQCTSRRHTLICQSDELSTNVLHNRVFRTTLHMLANHSRVERERRNELRRIEHFLHHIDLIRPELDVFSHIHLHRNNSNYGFLLRVCQLIWLNVLPEPGASAGPSSFDAVRDDDRAMARIFEEFVGNFYRFEVRQFEVQTQQLLKWDAADLPDNRYLPVMRADAILYSRQTHRVIVVDAKYYRDILVTRFEKERIRSLHLYQITAYLRSLNLKDKAAEGLLLYPQSGEAVSATFVLWGQRVRGRTLDLMQPWPIIHQALLDLVADSGA